MRMRASGALIMALLFCVPQSPAGAFELFGRKFFERDGQAEQEETIGEPWNYVVDFALPEGTDDLSKTLKGASTLWADREKPASGAAGLIVKARGDYSRLLNTLYGQARYGGSISITIDGREASDIQIDATLANPATVRVAIDPGPLFHFGEAAIVNPAPPAERRRDRVDDPAKEGFASGEVARSGTILAAGRLAVEAWRQQGHAKAEIIERRVTAAHDTRTVDAVLTVEPGRRACYGPLTVSGTERMDPDFVARQTGLVAGREYDPDDLERARERLSKLDVFRSARIEEAEEIGADCSLPLSLTVQERLPRRFGVGGTYSTLDGLGLQAYWMHRNLFGRAERLRFEGQVSGLGNTFDPAELTYRVGVTFLKPGVFTPDTDFQASVFGDREVLERYTRTGVSAEAGFRHEFTREFSGSLFVNGGFARFDDDFGTRNFTTVGLAGTVTYDSRDNPADATSGYFAELTAEPFYEMEYGNLAARMMLEGRAYYDFGSDGRYVVAGRAKIGSLAGAPIEETPPDKLFFAGGGGSVRGYAYRNIGVETPNGVAGGRSLMEASAELRTRITDSIGLVGFVDAGAVGAESYPDFSENVRVGVGAGLRYLTPLGPIRLDVAVPLDRQSGDPSVAFYVGIGQAF
ncbi:autotransporter assembly complex family protein [Nitratireductor sp. ZSWI3]|uniref:autotransporter assembly complex protein TamA n=1 Tax=Nitratireductor sp. ZSWI3 TaxID=2966359 RepID=UPI00215018AF|nr:autotransporter assembly complex family protein [Nitratireductor sp. ZSWI3]MCR4268051.1 autotransporter assembly complex protein TamA [Nitratireductor sp. ZSWI3]